MKIKILQANNQQNQRNVGAQQNKPVQQMQQQQQPAQQMQQQQQLQNANQENLPEMIQHQQPNDSSMIAR